MGCSGTREEGCSKRIIIWAPPRSRSTALEKSFRNRKDTKVNHEIFGDVYYNLSKKISEKDTMDKAKQEVIKRAAEKGQFAATTYEQVFNSLLQDESSQFIVAKELSYYYDEKEMTVERMKHFQHVFLTRHPRETLTSFFREGKKTDGTGYFDPKEAGFKELADVYNFVKTNIDSNPFVLDAEDLVRGPAVLEDLLKNMCARLNMPFDRGMTGWKSG
jgi:hypothetical protein